MSKFICKALQHVSSVRVSPTHNLYFFQNHPFSSSLKSIKNSQNQHSFTVTYLINSCGFPPEKALSASKYVKFESPDKPDSVLAFFASHGFTKTQILFLVRRLPPVLLCDPEKTLLPKLEFLKSRGVSSTDLARIVSLTPSVLKRSLENQIIPAFNLLSNLVQSEEKTIVAIKRFGRLLLYDNQTYVAPNVEIMREAGVPNANIVFLLKCQPRAFITSSDKFRQIVEQVAKMGFNPSRMKFPLAILALRSMTKSTWEKKLEVYKKWGLSDDDILVAFGKHTCCMTTSEDKITAVMDFFVNKMGWESSLVVRRPSLISLSLEKRIVPRCAVYQVLLSKGLIKTNDISFTRMLESHEEWFLKKFVYCHEEEAPKLLKLYKEKLDLAK